MEKLPRLGVCDHPSFLLVPPLEVIAFPEIVTRLFLSSHPFSFPPQLPWFSILAAPDGFTASSCFLSVRASDFALVIFLKCRAAGGTSLSKILHYLLISLRIRTNPLKHLRPTHRPFVSSAQPLSHPGLWAYGALSAYWPHCPPLLFLLPAGCLPYPLKLFCIRMCSSSSPTPGSHLGFPGNVGLPGAP